MMVASSQGYIPLRIMNLATNLHITLKHSKYYHMKSHGYSDDSNILTLCYVSFNFAVYEKEFKCEASGVCTVL